MRFEEKEKEETNFAEKKFLRQKLKTGVILKAP